MASQIQDREWTRLQGWISLIRSLSASPGWKKPAILVLVLGVRAGGLGESLGVELPPPDTYRLVKGLLWSLAPSPALTFLWDFWTLPPSQRHLCSPWLPLHSGHYWRREMPGAEVQGPREGSWLCPNLWAHPSQTTTLVEASISSHVEEAALGKFQGPSNLTVFCPKSEGIPEHLKASEK